MLDTTFNNIGLYNANFYYPHILPQQKYLLNVNDRKIKYCILLLLINIKREEFMHEFFICFKNFKMSPKIMISK